LEVRVFGHVGETGNFEGAGIGGDLAILLKALIRILIFHQNTLISNILKGIVHQPSIASVIPIALGTINQLLLAEFHQLFSFEEMKGLEGAGGGERPARTALALVFHAGHCTQGAPVDL